MKNFFNFILIIALVFNFHSSVLSQNQSAGQKNVQNHKNINLINPLYEMIARNIQIFNSSPLGSTPEIIFDIYIYHTNLAQSGPFEFAAGQYYFNFNPEIANGGTLTYSIVPNSTEFTDTNAVPINPSVVGNQLRLVRNVDLGGSGPIVSPIFPGTRVVRVKLETTAPAFAQRLLNLAWRDSAVGNPYTQAYAYIDDSVTNITNGGTLQIDTTNILLPVELSGFTSNVNRNNVTLNWSTTMETNNSGFDIERSRNNGHWTMIGFTQGNGSSSSFNNYSFEDNNLNSGVYKYRLKQIDYNGNYEYFDLQNEVVVGRPNEFSLKQNYPNPFNPTTKIDFDLPRDGFVRLKLFDINGREIKTLVNEYRNSGYYSINLEASALSTGVYIYRLEAGNFISTKKLILLK